MKQWLWQFIWVRRIVCNLRWFKAGGAVRVCSLEWWRYLGHWRSIEKNYTNYLKGKRVVVVGPAPSLEGAKSGELIDSYDIVVRLNVALPIVHGAEEDIGSRTDILYHALAERSGRDIAPLVAEWGLRYVCSSYPNCRWYTQININYLNKHVSTPTRIYRKATYRRLHRNLQGTANTGLMAIFDLLSFDINELFVVGFSFEDGVYSGKSRGTSVLSSDKILIEPSKPAPLPELMHIQSEQLDFFVKLIETDGRISVDRHLKELIYTKKGVSVPVR
jgi:hypothetical protein